MKTHMRARDRMRVELRACRVPDGIGRAENFDRFVAGEQPDDLGIDPRNGGEFAGPVRLVVRPADPRRPMRLPFGRHPERSAHRAHAPRYLRRIGP
jgi:hypothetical protein